MVCGSAWTMARGRQKPIALATGPAASASAEKQITANAAIDTRIINLIIVNSVGLLARGERFHDRHDHFDDHSDGFRVDPAELLGHDGPHLIFRRPGVTNNFSNGKLDDSSGL